MHWYIYMIYIYPITFCFSLFFNWVTALDLCTKCVSPKIFYFPNKWLHFENILYRHWYRGGVVWDCKWANFVQKQRNSETTELCTELNFDVSKNVLSPQIFRMDFYTQTAKAVFFSFCLVNNLCFQIAFEFRRKLKGVASLASPATCSSDTCMEEWWPLSCVKMCYPDSFRINGWTSIGVWFYVRRPI